MAHAKIIQAKILARESDDSAKAGHAREQRETATRQQASGWGIRHWKRLQFRSAFGDARLHRFDTQNGEPRLSAAWPGN
jgi:hypothetical protein